MKFNPMWLAVGLLIAASVTNTMRMGEIRQHMRQLDAAKVVLPPVTFTKYAEKRLDISQCYETCTNLQTIGPDETFNYACETCLSNIEGSGLACGITSSCDKPLAVDVVTGVVPR